MITVFTPAYNRGHLLHRVYESLCKQTFRDFEWVVVDDGSTDGTRKLFQPNENENSKGRTKKEELRTKNSQTDSKLYTLNSKLKTFPIRYFYQENGGKHRAINRGVKEAQGELFFIADSDDMLPPDALERVAKVYEDIKDDRSFGGLCGLDGTFEGKVIGSGLPQEVIDDTSIVVRFKLGVRGDMKEVFRTEVLREFPFPEIGGERFCPEVLLWNRIATKYKLRYFNQIIYLAEYQPDGITAGITRARMKSPVASMMTYAELTQYHDVPMKEKLKAAINYWRFRFCYNEGRKTKDEGLSPNPSPIREGERKYPKLRWYWNWVMPLGYLMHRRDVKVFL